jgi:hypothetical protein
MRGGFGSKDARYAHRTWHRGGENALSRCRSEPEGLARVTMHLDYKRGARPHERREVLKAGIFQTRQNRLRSMRAAPLRGLQ